MPEARITVPGDPIAKGRGRIVRLGNRMGIKTPDKTRRYEFTVREHAIREWGSMQPISDVPVSLTLLFVRSVPPSWSQKKQKAALAGDVLPITKPDLDNLEKSVKDGMNGVVYRDDAQVCRVTKSKVYGAQPRVEIVVMW
jgi:Holliday junction resolvase RusA-like endonuclease